MINRCRNRRYELLPQEISSIVKYNIISVIPEDEKVPMSISKGLPLVASFPNSKASIAMKKLAHLLINETYIEETVWKKVKNIFHLSRMKIKRDVPGEIQQHQMMQKESYNLTEIKSELIKDIKEELKSEIIKKVRERM